MSLPIINHVTWSTKVKELDKEVKYRPYVLNEERALLTAIEFGDGHSKYDTIIDITESCTKGEINTKSLPKYLVEYIFLQIFMKSNENKSASVYTCDNLVDGKNPNLVKEVKQKFKALREEAPEDLPPIEIVGFEGDFVQPDKIDLDAQEQEMLDEIENFHVCEAQTKIVVPLEKAKIVYPANESVKHTIQVNDTVSIKLKYIDIESHLRIDRVIADEEDTYENKRDAELEFIFRSIDSIVEKTKDGSENITKPNDDFTMDEFFTWLDGIDSKVYVAIQEYFQEFPSIELKLKVKCSSCGAEKEIVLRGIDDFFG